MFSRNLPQNAGRVRINTQIFNNNHRKRKIWKKSCEPMLTRTRWWCRQGRFRGQLLLKLKFMVANRKSWGSMTRLMSLNLLFLRKKLNITNKRLMKQSNSKLSPKFRKCHILRQLTKADSTTLQWEWLKTELRILLIQGQKVPARSLSFRFKSNRAWVPLKN